MKSMQLSLCALLMFLTGCVHVTSDWDPKGALIWRGTGASRLADPKKPDAQQKSISDEVTQILKKFPPGITPKS